MKEILHFAHGNGFPSPCYKQVLDRLNKHYHCIYIDKIGHNADFPVTENWQHLINELIESVKSQASQPVIGVGHSLGGVLTLLAAIQEPQLFKAVVLLDSPLINNFKSWIIRVAKWLRFIDLLTPAMRTRARRRHWRTRQDVLAYLQTKPLFKQFAPACLNDYIDYGLEKDEKGYSLRFNSEIEYQIYRTIPHNLYRYKYNLTVPCALIQGAQSNVVDRFDLHYMQKKYGIITYSIEGTHMFPMEHPEATAELILAVIKDIKNKRSKAC